MAYFDSSKNRALWNRELGKLREEKERRAREGYHPNEQKHSLKNNPVSTPFCVEITFEELEREEIESRKRPERNTASRTQERQREREHQAEPSAEKSSKRMER